MFSTRIDLTGQRFGRWTVLGFSRRGPGQSLWLCRCDCGTERDVGSANLRRGVSKSCGCHRSAVTRKRSTTHGRSIGKTGRTYNVWMNMRSRCLSAGNKDWPHYGGRGITICARWDSFGNFLADMGECPSPKHSIDRIDNNGNYEPGNCRWATQKEQTRNSRRNVMLTHNGETKCASAWDESCGFPPGVVAGRIRAGWSAGRALIEPVHS